MPKRPLQSPLEALVAAVICPPLTERGYERRGINFRYLFANGAGKILQVQPAADGNPTSQPFTLGLGLHVPIRPAASAAGPRFQFMECVISLDIARFRPPTEARDYRLQPGTEAAVRAAVQADLTQYALPFLDAYQSQDDILALLLQRPDLSLSAARLRVLAGHGYLAEARQQLEQELDRTDSPELRRLIQSFGQQLGLR